MVELYGWVRNITYFLILMTVVANLLPDKKYEKYVRLFAGMVLILLVLKPLTGSLKLEQKIAWNFESISFQKEADELKSQLLGMEGQRLADMASRYQKAIGVDIKSMAEGAGFGVKSVKVEIGQKEDSQQFGKVIGVSLILEPGGEGRPEDGGGRGKGDGWGAALETGGGDAAKREKETAKGQEQKKGLWVEPVEKVEKVEVGGDFPGASKGQGGNQSQGIGGDGDRKLLQEENAKILSLRRRISEYYDLEENRIEIQLENGKG